jgi:LysM repeat protein
MEIIINVRLGYNLGMFKIRKWTVFTVLILSVLAACNTNGNQNEGQEADSTVTLIPFNSATPTPVLATETPQPPTAAPLPSPTPTYRVYEVKSGDDLGGIAYAYGVSLSDLLHVNPDVNPYAMSIGTKLNIPPEVEKKGDDMQPTPVGVQLGNAVCYPADLTGTWCFSEARNPFEHGVENITALLRVQKSGEEHQETYEMFPGLNTMEANGTLPLMVYIPENLGSQFSTNVELVSALPLQDNTDRYLGVTVENMQTRTVSRAAVNVSGTVRLAEDAPKSAKQVWLLGVAYDGNNQIIGVRRHEMQVGIQPGGEIEFSFDVYLIAGNMDHIVVLAEAMP